jgi:phage repressor protein C with HTH and peptisase S24 domain
LGTSPEWLLTGKPSDDKQVTSNARVEGVFSTWDSTTPLEDDEVEIPFYHEIELSAGDGTYVELDRSGCKLRFAKPLYVKLVWTQAVPLALAYTVIAWSRFYLTGR